MTSPIKFGTDGWRALIADTYTFENVRICAEAFARYLEGEGLAGRGVVVGYDTRFGSERFAEAAAAVVAAHGIKVLLTDNFAPTPAVSHATVQNNAGGAIVITASHNPGAYNGFKIKPHYGGSASPEIVARVEAVIPEIAASGRFATDGSAPSGDVTRFDARGPYLDQLRGLLDVQALRAAPLRVLHDSMFGTAQGWLAELLAGGKLQFSELHAQVNPAFPGIRAPEPIDRNLGEAMALMKGGGFDVGFATDGDADRIGILDESGNYLDQLQVFGLLAYYLLDVRGERGPIVKSVTTTGMVERLAEIYGVPLIETPVGFKYLGPEMMKHDAIVAGEESGGYGFRGHIPERDGILSALYFLDFIVRTGKKPSQLLAELYERVGPHFYERVDVTIDERRREQIVESTASASPASIAGRSVASHDTVDGYRWRLDGGGWLLIRFSGTEPLMRVYTEVPDKALVKPVLDEGLKIAGVA
ncbi:MAG: phosphoglucomutase/phosphomannomutase family protein [Dehalococcoidia bacterium]|nr:phosphoglucomutase/phosphomannomutase family protein [Dehalococcoidia bacterium]